MELELRAYENGRWSASLPALDSPQTLVVVFGPSEPGPVEAALGELREAYPRSHLAGCSSAGEIHGPRVADGTLSVAIARFEHGSIATSRADVAVPSESQAAGERVARELSARPGLRAVLVLSDGLHVNGSELVRGIGAVVEPSVVVAGGLAGDGSRFQRTWTLDAGHPRPNVVTAVGLYGDRVAVGHGSKGGWDKFGPERTITRSRGNVLFELDGEPALALYKKYLGDRASGLPATGLLFPLALRADVTDDTPLVRTILAVDEQAQSLTFAGDVPEGQLVQLMRANFDRLIGASGDAAALTKAGAPGTDVPTLAIAVSCIGRRLVLGERVEEELEAAVDALPRGAGQVGFYSYGEISRDAVGTCELHNQTMTLTTIAER